VFVAGRGSNLLETPFHSFIMDAILPRSMKEVGTPAACVCPRPVRIALRCCAEWWEVLLGSWFAVHVCVTGVWRCAHAMQDYAKRFGRDEVSAGYAHQDASKLLPDVSYDKPLTRQQLELVKAADLVGALSQVGACAAIWCSVACGMWHVACGMWHVACGMWHVACGMWHVACGIGMAWCVIGVLARGDAWCVCALLGACLSWWRVVVAVCLLDVFQGRFVVCVCACVPCLSWWRVVVTKVSIRTYPKCCVCSHVSVCLPVSHTCQYNSPGFMPNTRQYRQFGLAAIELAQVQQRQLP
jgi:hypothetical protein